MHDLSLDMYQATRRANQAMTVLFVLETAFGAYLFAEKDVDPSLLGIVGRRKADGSWKADGTIKAGADSMPVLGHGGEVHKIGRLLKTLTPIETDLLGAYRQSETSSVTLTLRNAAGRISEIEATQPLNGASGKIMLLYPGLPLSDAVTMFRGRVTSSLVDLGSGKCSLTLNADPVEGADHTAEYSPRRAWDYTISRKPTDYIADVWGDLTDGSGGQWIIPCIDTASHVHAFAGHKVIDQTPTIYDKDNNVINPAYYTFDASNDYQGKGTIATVTFSADMTAYEPLSAKGKGRKDGSGVLIENPVDVVRDFLIDVVGWPAKAVDDTSLATARAIAEARGYKAAGVIKGPRTVGYTLSEIMRSFFGWWWLGGAGSLRLAFTTDFYPTAYIAADLREGPMLSGSVTTKTKNVVNRAGIKYRQRHTAEGEYQSGLGPGGSADVTSTRHFGARSHTFELAWVRSGSVAQSLQSLVVSQFCVPRRVISAETSDPLFVFAELGDLIALSSDVIMDDQARLLRNQIFQVQSVDIDPMKQTTRIVALDTQAFRTNKFRADGTYKADSSIKAGGDRDMTKH